MRTSILLFALLLSAPLACAQRNESSRDSVRLTKPRTSSRKPCLLLFTNNRQ